MGHAQGSHIGEHMLVCNYERGWSRCKDSGGMQACPDAHTRSNEGVGLDEWQLAHAHRATEGHTCLHTTMQRGEADVGSQLDMHTCTDVCTHT